MNWGKLKEELYYLDGSLRDIYVKETNIEDNQKWIEYVNSFFRIECFDEITNKIENKINFKRVDKYWKGEIESIVCAKVFIDENIQINNHFFCYSEIENDIDPTEIKSIEDHNRIVDYMKGMSKLLNKRVILTPENTPEIILMKIENDLITYL